MLLTVISAVVTHYMDSIAGAWKLLIVTGAGTGAVLILRWYWWRINAWSEVSAMAAAFVVSIVLQTVFHLDSDNPVHLGHAIRPGSMVRARHPHTRTETSCNRLYPLVICGNNRAREVSGLGSALPDVLEHGFGGDGDEDFAGKTGRSESGWDHAQDFTRHTR